jgi:hypothetical protein
MLVASCTSNLRPAPLGADCSPRSVSSDSAASDPVRLEIDVIDSIVANLQFSFWNFQFAIPNHVTASFKKADHSRR